MRRLQEDELRTSCNECEQLCPMRCTSHRSRFRTLHSTFIVYVAVVIPNMNAFRLFIQKCWVTRTRNCWGDYLCGNPDTSSLSVRFRLQWKSCSPVTRRRAAMGPFPVVCSIVLSPKFVFFCCFFFFFAGALGVGKQCAGLLVVQFKLPLQFVVIRYFLFCKHVTATPRKNIWGNANWHVLLLSPSFLCVVVLWEGNLSGAELFEYRNTKLENMLRTLVFARSWILWRWRRASLFIHLWISPVPLKKDRLNDDTTASFFRSAPSPRGLLSLFLCAPPPLSVLLCFLSLPSKLASFCHRRQVRFVIDLLQAFTRQLTAHHFAVICLNKGRVPNSEIHRNPGTGKMCNTGCRWRCFSTTVTTSFARGVGNEGKHE